MSSSSTPSTPLRVFVTGASRGIGLELVRQYAAADSRSLVLAGARDPAAPALLAAAREFPNIKPIRIDTAEDDSIHAAAAEVARLTNAIDLLVNNAGVAGSGLATVATRADFQRIFNVNVFGCAVTTQAFLPLLLAGASADGSAQPKVAFIGSILGSVSLTKMFYEKFPRSLLSAPYAGSKTALNHLVASFAAEEPRVTFLSLHPGWVKTDMGSDAAPLEVADSARSLLQVIRESGADKSGAYIDAVDGAKILPY